MAGLTTTFTLQTLMPFSVIANAKTFEPRADGVSVLNTLTFADPTNEFRWRPGAVKNGVLSAGVTRVIEKNATVGSDTVRKNMVVSLNIQLPADGSFTQAEVDQAIADHSEALTTAVISRLLQGES